MNTTLELLHINPDSIIVSDRLRHVDDAWVEAISVSVEMKGQDTPIKVRRTGGNKLHLVAGAHRLEACRRIGIEVRAEIIECSELEARLIEIDENLFRRELGALDRAIFLAERKKVYLELYPETNKGGDRGNQHTGGKERQSDILSFSQETAKRINLSSRSVERAISIAEKIPADVRKRLIGTKLAEKQSDLLYLASLAPSVQRKAVTLLGDGEAGSIKVAVARVNGEDTPVSNGQEKQFTRLLDAWSCAGSKVRVQFLNHLRELGEMEA